MNLILMSIPVLLVALQYAMVANRPEPCPVVARIRHIRQIHRLGRTSRRG